MDKIIPSLITDLRKPNITFDGAAQNGFTCFAIGMASLLTYEVKRLQSELIAYHVSSQHIVDDMYRKFPNEVNYWKRSNSSVDGFERCDVRDMDHYRSWRLTPFKYAKEHGVLFSTDYKPPGLLDKEAIIPEGRKVKIRDFVTHLNPEQVKAALEDGHPVLAVIDIREDIFSFEGPGVYETQTGEVIGKHTVLIMGIGVENGVEYYLVFNSWGKEWGGYDGFGKMKCSLVRPIGYANEVYIEE